MHSKSNFQQSLVGLFYHFTVVQVAAHLKYKAANPCLSTEHQYKSDVITASLSTEVLIYVKSQINKSRYRKSQHRVLWYTEPISSFLCPSIPTALLHFWS